MIDVLLDGEQIRDREQLHSVLAERLDFPAWYGANLDALYDCLTDIRDDTRLTILHSGKLQETLGVYGERFLEVLGEAEEDNVRFTFVLDP